MKLDSEYNEYEEFYRHLPLADKLTFKRELVAVPLVILALVILSSVLFHLGIIRFGYYQAMAADNRIARIVLPAPRGEILDRNGNPLAVNHAVYDCYFIASDDVEQDVADLTEIGNFLGLAASQLDDVINGRREAVSVRSMASELWAAELGALGAKSILVKSDLNQVEVTRILERTEQFPRTFLEMSYRRSYPAGEYTAQVVGYMGEISENELVTWGPLGYRMGDMLGKAGLEKQYDNILRGQSGEKLVQVNARGRILGEAKFVPAVVPENGAVVAHDGEVQIFHEGDVLDFHSGPLIVQVSWLNGRIKGEEIGFAVIEGQERAVRRIIFVDPPLPEGRNTLSDNSYSPPIPDDWHVFRTPGEIPNVEGRVVMRPPVLLPTGGAPLRTTLDLEMQRAIEEIMGDTVGGVIAMDPRTGAILAMVSEPAYDPNVFAPGGVDPEGWQAILGDEHYPLLNRPVQNAYIPGSVFKIVTLAAAGEIGLINSTWDCRGSIEVGNRRFRCWNRGGHGVMNFTQAMAQSCDVAFYEMGQDLGHDKIAEIAQLFGLGSRLGIDLPDERSGLIPDEEWKMNRFGEDERWYLGDTMNMVIGQGFVQMTVLQVARTTAVIANRGNLVPPHLNRLLTPAQSMIERIQVSETSINAVRRGMRQCVTSGTGTGSSLSWIELAGKTGTADDPPREEPHSWFTSFGPYDDPLLVITVLCENGGHGDETAVPLTRLIWESEAVRNYLAEEGFDN